MIDPYNDRRWFPDWRALLTMLVGSLLLAFILRNAPLLAHDWRQYFVPEILSWQYPIFITYVMRPVTQGLAVPDSIAVLHGCTVAAAAVYAFYLARQAEPEKPVLGYVSALLVVAHPLMWMLLWLGQIEVVALLGLMTAPVGILLIFAKPHLAPFAMLGSRRLIVFMALTVLISIVIWGLWPLDILNVGINQRVAARHPLAMGWADTSPVVALVGLALLALTDRNPFRLMAAGAFLSPFFMPYHFYIMMPALGLVKGWRQMVLWAYSGLFMVGVTGFATVPLKVLYFGFPLMLWAFTAKSLKPSEIMADPDIIINRVQRYIAEVLDVLRGRRPVLPLLGFPAPKAAPAEPQPDTNR